MSHKKEKVEIRTCCETLSSKAHDVECPVMQRLDESFKKDGERWIHGYQHMSTEKVRQRALAGRALLNGHNGNGSL
jgi:hypothetical protein